MQMRNMSGVDVRGFGNKLFISKYDIIDNINKIYGLVRFTIELYLSLQFDAKWQPSYKLTENNRCLQ